MLVYPNPDLLLLLKLMLGMKDGDKQLLRVFLLPEVILQKELLAIKKTFTE